MIAYLKSFCFSFLFKLLPCSGGSWRCITEF